MSDALRRTHHRKGHYVNPDRKGQLRHRTRLVRRPPRRAARRQPRAVRRRRRREPDRRHAASRLHRARPHPPHHRQARRLRRRRRLGHARPGPTTSATSSSQRNTTPGTRSTATPPPGPTPTGKGQPDRLRRQGRPRRHRLHRRRLHQHPAHREHRLRRHVQRPTPSFTAAAAIADLAVAYKNSAGDLAIAWTTASTLNIIKRTAGTFGAASASGKTFDTTTYVAMTYGFDWDLVVTGTETVTLKPTLWTIVHGDGNDAPPATWGTLDPQQQAESDSLVTYKAPPSSTPTPTASTTPRPTPSPAAPRASTARRCTRP